MAKQRIKRSLVLAIVGGLAMSGATQASLFNFTGTIDYHNDVVQFVFTLDNDATDISIWTDSFDSGANFDPITGLWNDDGTLIAQNDDNPFIDPANQTFWDSGIEIASLLAGDYIFTIASYDNFANGSTLSDGFMYDGQTPIPIEDWWVGGAGNWSVWFDGVDAVTPPSIPEPSALSLLAIGFAGFGYQRWRREKAA